MFRHLPLFFSDFFFFMTVPPPTSTLFPYTTLFRSVGGTIVAQFGFENIVYAYLTASVTVSLLSRSEEHTSELQSHSDLVCRLLLEKKKIYSFTSIPILRPSLPSRR